MEKLGEKIKGSRFIRVFCSICNTPMRTTTEEINDEHLCELCSPKHCGCNAPKDKLHNKYEDIADIDAFLPSWKRK